MEISLHMLNLLWLEISQVKQNHMCLDLEVVCVALKKLKYRIAMNLAFMAIFWTYRTDVQESLTTL